MRTQDQNPAYQRYAHLLPESGLYPARYVDIFWNDTNHKISDLEVVFIPRESGDLPNPSEDPNFWDKYAAYNNRWTYDLGNSCNDWLTSDGKTAESVFGYLLRAGFASEAELKGAIEEFAHIEECSWARAMLRGFIDREIRALADEPGT
jgi:hypothetical protein